MDARSSDLAEQVDAFLEASMRDWTGRAARLLAAAPQIAGYDFRTAVVLGDAGRVGQMLEQEPGLATRPDPQWGWTPLHAVCGSRWHRLDPARADGMLAVARLLLDAGDDGQAALVDAAGHGQAEAVRLMLDAGIPLDARDQDGATPLHAAALSGSAQVIRLLLDRGADIEAHDTTYDTTPLDWAQVGSGFQHVDNPAPDWITTIRELIEAGASTAGITLSPDDPKPPSPQVAQLLRDYGIGAGQPPSHS